MGVTCICNTHTYGFSDNSKLSTTNQLGLDTITLTLTGCSVIHKHYNIVNLNYCVTAVVHAYMYATSVCHFTDYTYAIRYVCVQVV